MYARQLLQLRSRAKAHQVDFPALAGAVPCITPVGISDLAVEGKKFSGNAQQRKRDHLLHHGTLLYSFDLDLLPRYLKAPPRQPEYRAQRAHEDFLGNVPLTAAFC